ncbi:MAG: bifunctional aspartate kinase/homoserine dehydrogenase I, partial [Ginsengibacter sp.]
MKVLKFGGSSVANAHNINRVISILEQSVEKDGNTIIILSALGGATDALLEAAALASRGNASYNEKLQAIEHRHLSTVRELIPLDKQSSVLSMVKKRCNEIEDICKGVF